MELFPDVASHQPCVLVTGGGAAHTTSSVAAHCDGYPAALVHGAS
jgi:hypothetical protein